MSYSGSAGGGIGGVSPASTPLAAAVPGTKILLCRSGVKGKTPDPAGAEYGEVFVNYHSGSPMLCFKDNAGEIVEIKPTRQIDGGGGETPPSTGNEIGDTLWDGTHFRVWDGSTWLAIGPNDLAYVQKVDGGTITNSAGSDVDIPVVNNIQAGLMLPADKNKIDGYPATPGDLSLDLQQVTDNGNTTKNLIETSGGVKLTGGNATTINVGITGSATNLSLVAQNNLNLNNADGTQLRVDANGRTISLLNNKQAFSSSILSGYTDVVQAYNCSGSFNSVGTNPATTAAVGYFSGMNSAVDCGAGYSYVALLNDGGGTITNGVGYYSSIASNASGYTNAFSMYHAGGAPSFFAGDTYIGGDTTRNTRELWESTLTEEQKEELAAGTLTIPANVSTPGDGSFVRQWWYDQQSAEDQALIDAGELEYPEHLQAANFTDTFALGQNTKISLLSNGTAEFTNGIRITNFSKNNAVGQNSFIYLGANTSATESYTRINTAQLSHRHSYSATLSEYLRRLDINSNGSIFAINRKTDPDAPGSSSSGTTYAQQVTLNVTGGGITSNKANQRPAAIKSTVHVENDFVNTQNAGDQMIFAYLASATSSYDQATTGSDKEANLGGYGFYAGAASLLAKNTFGFHCAYSGKDNLNLTGFQSDVTTRVNANNFNFYASKDAPNFFAGNTYIGGTDTAPNITLYANGSAHFKGNVTSDGTIGFNLEPDNEANYTVTTEDYEEQEEVTPYIPAVLATYDEEGNELTAEVPAVEATYQTVAKTREIRTYNGPTLDVKEALLSLQQKVNDRDAVIASLTARIAALEA